MGFSSIPTNEASEKKIATRDEISRLSLLCFVIYNQFLHSPSTPDEWIMVWIDSSWWGMIKFSSPSPPALQRKTKNYVKGKEEANKNCVYQHLSTAWERKKKICFNVFIAFSPLSCKKKLKNFCRPTSHQHFFAPLNLDTTNVLYSFFTVHVGLSLWREDKCIKTCEPSVVNGFLDASGVDGKLWWNEVRLKINLSCILIY